MARQNPQQQQHSQQRVIHEDQQPQETSNKPVHTCRHRNLKASVWRNDTDKGPIYNVTIVRSYRQDDGWHDSVSFGYDDLMNVAKLMYDCHSVISSIRAREAAARQQPQLPMQPQQRQVTRR